MIELLDISKKNIIATRASGSISKNDLEKIHPILDGIVEGGHSIKWYFEMVDFTGWDAKGLIEDLKVDFSHASDYEKVAMVGEKKWQDYMSQLMKPFTKAEIRYFDLENKEEAEQWIYN